MTTYTGYAIEMTADDETCWVVIIDNGDGKPMGKRTHNPFKATIYGDYNKALQVLGEIQKGGFLNYSAGATMVVTFHLETEGP